LKLFIVIVYERSVAVGKENSSAKSLVVFGEKKPLTAKAIKNTDWRILRQINRQT
jgi:hypothetical protein